MNYKIIKGQEQIMSVAEIKRTGNELRDIWKIRKNQKLVCTTYKEQTANHIMRLLEHDDQNQAKKTAS